MDAHRILEMVNDFPSWKGNTYTLATLVAEAASAAQREADATIVDGVAPSTPPDQIASLIRGQ